MPESTKLADQLRKTSDFAIFSNSRKYRYALGRLCHPTFDKVMPNTLLAWIMLNPSTGTATLNDPTLTRCIGFAERWGFPRFVVVNLFAFRATKPQAMIQADDPVGPNCDYWIRETLRLATTVVAAWGPLGEYKNRDWLVQQLAREHSRSLYCVGETAGSFPRHPLRVPYAQALEPYRIAGRPDAS